MMLWCEMHNSTGVKGGITNFDASEYEKDIPWLQQCTQASMQTCMCSPDVLATSKRPRQIGKSQSKEGLSSGAASLCAG